MLAGCLLSEISKSEKVAAFESVWAEVGIVTLLHPQPLGRLYTLDQPCENPVVVGLVWTGSAHHLRKVALAQGFRVVEDVEVVGRGETLKSCSGDEIFEKNYGLGHLHFGALREIDTSWSQILVWKESLDQVNAVRQPFPSGLAQQRFAFLRPEYSSLLGVARYLRRCSEVY